MEAYEYLEKHEFFSSKREFNHHISYVFKKTLENGKKRVGTIQAPTDKDGEFDFYFSNEIQTETWFQELVEKTEKKSDQLFRLRKIVEGNVESN